MGFAPGATRTMYPRYPSDGAPDGTVGRADGDGVDVDRDARVPARDRRSDPGSDVRVASAVAVGVEDERRPALRSHLVAGLLEHLAVQPSDRARPGDAGAGPERLIRVLRERQMVRGEAGADQRELSRTPGRTSTGAGPIPGSGNAFADGCADPCLAEIRVRVGTHARREPDAPSLVHHRVVIERLAVPDRIGSPVRRRRHRVGLRRRRRGSRTGCSTWLAVCVAGSSTGTKSVLSSGDP